MGTEFSCKTSNIKMTERRSYPKKGNWPLTSVLGTYRKTPAVSGVASLTGSSKCMRAKSLQSCVTLCDPMDDSPSGSSVHGIPQARVLEWVAIPFSWVGKGLNPYLMSSALAGRVLYH